VLPLPKDQSGPSRTGDSLALGGARVSKTRIVRLPMGRAASRSWSTAIPTRCPPMPTHRVTFSGAG
jgi:hypothetical protein